VINRSTGAGGRRMGYACTSGSDNCPYQDRHGRSTCQKGHHCWVWRVGRVAQPPIVEIRCDHCDKVLSETGSWVAQPGDAKRARQSQDAHESFCPRE